MPTPHETAAARTEAPADPANASRRGFGVLGIAAMLGIVLVGSTTWVPVNAILVLLWARWSRTPWPALGLARPASWVRTLLVGLPLGIALKLAMKSLVMPLLGAPALNAAYHDLVGNRAALPAAIYAMIVRAGLGEEIVFRGFLFERFGRLLGTGARARVAIVVVTSMIFAIAHYPDQGLAGAEQAAMTGLVFGTLYSLTGTLWLAMTVHAAFDLAAVAILYANQEARLAHLFFH